LSPGQNPQHLSYKKAFL